MVSGFNLSSAHGRNKKEAIICAQLRQLVNDSILLKDALIKPLYDQAMAKDNKAWASRKLRAVLATVSEVQKKKKENRPKKRTAYLCEIGTFEQAQMVYETFMDKQKGIDKVKDLYKTKLCMLEAVSLGNEDNYLDRLKIPVPPGESMTREFTVEGERLIFEQNTVCAQITVEYVVSSTSNRKMDVQQAVDSESYTITPKFLISSLIAALFGVFGVVVNAVAGVNALDSIKSTPFLCYFSAAILSFVFFSIYEYTTVGKRLNMPVDARSAVFVGFIAGLAQNKVVDVLQAFL